MAAQFYQDGDWNEDETWDDAAIWYESQWSDEAYWYDADDWTGHWDEEETEDQYYEDDWPPTPGLELQSPESWELNYGKGKGKGKKGRGKHKGKGDGCFRCGSKFHNQEDCPIPADKSKGKGKG